MASKHSSEELSSSEDDETLFHTHYSRPASSPSSSPSPPPPHPQLTFFAPPFYNRPPTPLPPSPSLTSLLRPSRPTTPDASDVDEYPAPLPRASPKVPTYEYYGFVLYLFSSLAFLMYLLWSYLPSPFLHALGIYYYPNRWWSLAIPAWLVMLLVWIYVALAAYNTGYLTLPMGSIETIVDEAANVATLEGKGSAAHSWATSLPQATRGRAPAPGHRRQNSSGTANAVEPPKRSSEKARLKEEKAKKREMRRGQEIKPEEWRKIWSVGTDACLDVPLGGVCEVLYGEARDASPEREGRRRSVGLWRDI
jgi:phosphatidylinositol glycan class P protein